MVCFVLFWPRGERERERKRSRRRRRKTLRQKNQQLTPRELSTKNEKKTVEHAAKAAEKRRAGKLTGRAYFQKMDSGAGGLGVGISGVGGVGGGEEGEEEEEEGTSYPSDEDEADADRRARERLLRGESDLLDDDDDDDEGDSDDEDFLDELESKLTTAG